MRMNDILFYYQKINPTTWAYVASLIMIGLFFKFGRFWSVRNLDLMLLILVAPGLLLVHFGTVMQAPGYRPLANTPDGEVAAEVPFSTNGDQSFSAGVPDTNLREAATTNEPGDSDGRPVDSIAVETDLVEDDDGGSESPEAEPVAEGVAQEGAASLGAEIVAPPGATKNGVAQRGHSVQRLGYIWLFCTSSLLLVRMLVDPSMVRRPLLEPNMTVGGLTFICCSLFVFLMANVITGTPTEDDLIGPRRAAQMIAGEEADMSDSSVSRHGPGMPLLFMFPSIPTSLVQGDEQAGPQDAEQVSFAITAKTMAILSNLAIIVGLVMIGYRHFDNIRMGIGAAALFLILPYTSQMTGRVDHALPAALLVWAIVCYRLPGAAGAFLGLAMGVVYYPFFLLPLWVSFYWQRGLGRFLASMGVTLLIVVLSLIPTSSSMEMFFEQVQRMFGLWRPVMEGLEGFWAHYDPVYRIPVLAAFFGLSISLAIWPAQKNLGTLMSCSAAVMLAAQFWHGHGGGLFIAWYAPLLILTIFRPNLEDRVALAVLGESWFPRRRVLLPSVDKAA